VSNGIKTIIYPVTDLAAAKAIYQGLARTDPYVDQPYYTGFAVDGQDIGLDPNGHRHGMPGPVAYWHVDDIAKSMETLLAAGAETLQEINDVGAGKRVACVKDADGNVIGLLQEA
jgi:predicted enzyme related to lactoylglutathione lyase